jgi:hypothetical protein
MVRRHAQSGYGLLLAIAAMALVAVAVMTASQLLQTRFDEFRVEERQVALTALTDAALAETLAGLAASPAFAGVPEHVFAQGRIGSTVRPFGPGTVEVTARGTRHDASARVVAEVDLSGPRPKVLRWTRR